MTFNEVLEKYRKEAFSERNKGDRFERLMQAYLRTDRKYADKFKNVWLWNEFPGKTDLGGADTGIDLVAEEHNGDHWAIQCKFFQEGATIDKPKLDSFLSTSNRTFKNEQGQTTRFAARLWIDTTGKGWGINAEKAIENQVPPVAKLTLHQLRDAAVEWDKLEKGVHGDGSRAPKKEVYDHVLKAVEATHEYFKSKERGKLLMACGTGKTLTSLKIAEKETEGKGLVLFLVPSIALLGQTLREWYNQADERINAVCICSDAEVSNARKKNEDDELRDTVESLAEPASTKVSEVLKQFEKIAKAPKGGMTVVFSTYQSIAVIADAQKALMEKGWPQFDLIICDEAHRTTGVTLAGKEDAAFVKVHDASLIRSKRRLYMTATPRLYDDTTKSKAIEKDAVLCSMDDPDIYGDVIYNISFSDAVDLKVLTDYKVLVLTLSEAEISSAVQHMVEDANHEIAADDAAKMIGVINALSKNVLGDDGLLKAVDPLPMKRAVAFCQRIEHRRGQNSSKMTTAYFNELNTKYIKDLPTEVQEKMVSIEADHVDGAMGAARREERLSWLKEVPENENVCRILTNVRCLSEGVDVPALDAVIFLAARSSQIDVVQSVGRVMRRAPGKKYGYIIIPVIVASDVKAEDALDNNERFRVVWQVLNALRSHDERLLEEVSKLDLNGRSEKIITIMPNHAEGRRDGESDGGGEMPKGSAIPTHQFMLEFEGLRGAIYAKMVEKVGDRKYWERWASDVAEIAQRFIERINRIIDGDEAHKKAFDAFLDGLHQNINPSINREQAVEMLSQHIITQPVFEALFEGYSFANKNAISVAMQQMVDLLDDKALDKDLGTLEKFYASVRRSATGIKTHEGRQKVVLELYDKFFKTAFPKMVEKLGIVYTPVEVVDFIIHSVDDVLKQEFGRSLSDENVHILDPFTGTGTFITRLLQSGLIAEKDLERKYKHEIHANEIVLLAYYIAAINIENAYHDATPDPDDGLGTDKFTPFDGIVLTDTFQLGETDASERLITEMFPQNSERVTRQKKAPLRVIIGNPPYSVGQKSANDNAQNQKYERLDSRIENTYVARSTAGLNKSVYDAYIKAFRWSTDRLDKEGGIVAFVTNGAWLDGNSQDGFRKCLEEEFSTIYVFNLRGNQRTSGELSRQEGGKIFGSGSRTPIAITLLVKKPKTKQQKATIHYHDIGDYLTREQKLAIINKAGSVGNLDWKNLEPNAEGDWLSQRNSVFETFIAIEPIKKFELKSQAFFNTYAIGVATNRDAWVYNFSQNGLEKNMLRSIEFYNQQQKDFSRARINDANLIVDDFITTDPSKISWTRALKKDVTNRIEHQFNSGAVSYAVYRPFCKQSLYFEKAFIEAIGLAPKLFPTPSHKNFVVCVSGVGVTKEFSCIITDTLPDLELIGKSQCFPLYWYEEVKRTSATLFDGAIAGTEYVRRDGVSDWILKEGKKRYGTNVSKEDIFYYVYGFLHSPHYREKFSNDLKKMLPRLPLVETVKDFWAFSKAGRKLAELHVGYEKVPANNDVVVTGAEKLAFLDEEPKDTKHYIVEKMRFPKKGQKDTIIYNSRITVSNIPAEAYDYVVNGKSAIEWVMERYAITTHKESGIRNDPNDWAKEVGNPRYILDLLLSVIEVSVRSVEIVRGLPGVGVCS